MVTIWPYVFLTFFLILIDALLLLRGFCFTIRLIKMFRMSIICLRKTAPMLGWLILRFIWEFMISLYLQIADTLDFSFLRHVDEASLKSLAGVRSNNSILKLVPNLEVYFICLVAIQCPSCLLLKLRERYWGLLLAASIMYPHVHFGFGLLDVLHCVNKRIILIFHGYFDPKTETFSSGDFS